MITLAMTEEETAAPSLAFRAVPIACWPAGSQSGEHIQPELGDDGHDNVTRERNENDPAEKSPGGPPNPQRRRNHSFGDIPQCHYPKQRNRHSPSDHAPRAQGAERKDALRDQPDDEDERRRHPYLEKQPEPPIKPGTGKQRGTNYDRRHPPGQPEYRVRKAEDRPLPRGKVRCALHKHAEITGKHGLRRLQQMELLDGKRESGDPAHGAGENEENPEAQRATHGLSRIHPPSIAGADGNLRATFISGPCVSARQEPAMCEHMSGVPAATRLGWDNAEHDPDRATCAPSRGNPTPADRFAAYPDRTPHEYNASMTDDDAYWAALPDTLTPTQLAKILNVGKPAVLSRLRSGVIPGYQIRASWIIFKSEIRAWLASTSNRAPVEQPKPVDVLADYGDEMTYQDLMALFGKTKQTIYIWIHEDEIPAFHVGNRWVLHKSQLRQRLREISNQRVRSGDIDDTPKTSQ